MAGHASFVQTSDVRLVPEAYILRPLFGCDRTGGIAQVGLLTSRCAWKDLLSGIQWFKDPTALIDLKRI